MLKTSCKYCGHTPGAATSAWDAALAPHAHSLPLLSRSHPWKRSSTASCCQSFQEFSKVSGKYWDAQFEKAKRYGRVTSGIEIDFTLARSSLDSWGGLDPAAVVLGDDELGAPHGHSATLGSQPPGGWPGQWTHLRQRGLSYSSLIYRRHDKMQQRN